MRKTNKTKKNKQERKKKY